LFHNLVLLDLQNHLINNYLNLLDHHHFDQVDLNYLTLMLHHRLLQKILLDLNDLPLQDFPVMEILGVYYLLLLESLEYLYHHRHLILLVNHFDRLDQLYHHLLM
tara:strand:- start:47 stop:361 length:315 start_codon:yes stop_codon:yes gene_type:complete